MSKRFNGATFGRLACCVAWLAGLGFPPTLRADGAEAPPPPKKLRVAFTRMQFPNVSVQDAQAATKVWAETVLARRQLNYQIETLILESLPEVIEAAKNDMADLIVLSGQDYLNLRDSVEIEPALIGVLETPADMRGCLVVRRDSGISSLKDLQGRRLIIDTKQVMDIPRIWLDVCLMEEGLPPVEQHFASVEEVEKVSKAVIPVFLKQADACIVRDEGYRTMRELNPQIDNQMRVLLGSVPLYLGYMAWTPRFPAEDKAVMNENIARLREDPEGEQILELFKVYRMVPFDARAHLLPLESLMERHRALLQIQELEK